MNGSKLKRSLLLGGIVTTALGTMGNNCGVNNGGFDTCSEICANPQEQTSYDLETCGCLPDMNVPIDAATAPEDEATPPDLAQPADGAQPVDASGDATD